MAKLDDALATVCEREYPRLVGLLALRVGDRHVAEELAQDALAELCRKWPDVQQPSAWLTTVALNRSRSWLRRKLAEQRAYRRHGSGEESQLPPDTATTIAVRQAVSQLPHRQQEALILRFYEGLSVAEAADVMGCAEGNVKALSHRALRRLESSSHLTQEALDHA